MPVSPWTSLSSNSSCYLPSSHSWQCLSRKLSILISSICHLPLIQSAFCLHHSTILDVTKWSRNSPSTNVNSGISIFILSGLPTVWPVLTSIFLRSGISLSFSLLTWISQSHLLAYFFLHKDYVPQGCSSKYTESFSQCILFGKLHTCPWLKVSPVPRLQIKMAHAAFSPSSRSMSIPAYFPCPLPY